MDSSNQYPVPKDLIFDSGHLERILIALLRTDLPLALDLNLKQDLYCVHLGFEWSTCSSLLAAIDDAVANLRDDLRWKFFEEYDKGRKDNN